MAKRHPISTLYKQEFSSFPCERSSPVQKRISKRVEVAKGLFRVHREGISRDDSLDFSIHEGSEAVGGWLRPNSATKKILLYEIP